MKQEYVRWGENDPKHSQWTAYHNRGVHVQRR